MERPDKQARGTASKIWRAHRKAGKPVLAVDPSKLTDPCHDVAEIDRALECFHLTCKVVSGRLMVGKDNATIDTAVRLEIFERGLRSILATSADEDTGKEVLDKVERLLSASPVDDSTPWWITLDERAAHRAAAASEQ